MQNLNEVETKLKSWKECSNIKRISIKPQTGKYGSHIGVDEAVTFKYGSRDFEVIQNTSYYNSQSRKDSCFTVYSIHGKQVTRYFEKTYIDYTKNQIEKYIQKLDKSNENRNKVSTKVLKNMYDSIKATINKAAGHDICVRRDGSLRIHYEGRNLFYLKIRYELNSSEFTIHLCESNWNKLEIYRISVSDPNFDYDHVSLKAYEAFKDQKDFLKARLENLLEK